MVVLERRAVARHWHLGVHSVTVFWVLAEIPELDFLLSCTFFCDHVLSACEVTEALALLILI
jgi:hypothetical protein